MDITNINDIIEVEDIKCYIDDKGVINLSLEDVSYGLGFDFTTEINGKKYNRIRWSRVEKYLLDLEFVPLMAQKDDNKTNLSEMYIPENIFYMLAMKANNSRAKKFQQKVANEILPSIRRNGFYMNENLISEIKNNPEKIVDFLIKLERDMKILKTLAKEICVLKEDYSKLKDRTFELENEVMY